MASQYQVHTTDLIGHGNFGCVYRATNRAGVLVAVRVVRFADHQRERVQQAENCLRLPNEHPNIIDIYDVEEEADKKLIFMEFCELGNLREFYRRRELSVSEKVELMRQIATGIQHLHSHGIIHRDITPENILVQKKSDGTPEIKLSDFGVSKFIEPGMESTMSSDVGSSFFKAPEFWRRDSDGRLQYKKSVDVFAMGLTFLAMLQGNTDKSLAPGYEIFDGVDPSERFQPIGYTMNVRRRYKAALPVVVSDEGDDTSRRVRALIRKMIQFEPEDRISCDEVVETLTQCLV